MNKILSIVYACFLLVAASDALAFRAASQGGYPTQFKATGATIIQNVPNGPDLYEVSMKAKYCMPGAGWIPSTPVYVHANSSQEAKEKALEEMGTPADC